MKKLASIAAATLLASTGFVFANGDNEGKAVGQNPLLLEITKCANNGGGNDGEYGKWRWKYDRETKEKVLIFHCIKGVGSEKRDLDPTEYPGG